MMGNKKEPEEKLLLIYASLTYKRNRDKILFTSICWA